MEFNPKNVYFETHYPFYKGRMRISLFSVTEREITIIFPSEVAVSLGIADELKLKELPPVILDFEIHFLDQRPQFSLECSWLPDYFLDYLSGKIQATYVPNVDYESTLWMMEKCLNKELKKLVRIVLKCDLSEYAMSEVIRLTGVIKETDLLYYYGWIENAESSRMRPPCSCTSWVLPGMPQEVRSNALQTNYSLLGFFKDFLTRKLDKRSYYYGIFEDDLPKVISEKPGQSYLCEICFLNVPMESCIKLNCSHIFCKECLSSYLKDKIESRNVLGITCPQLCCNVKIGNMTSTILDTSYFEQFKILVLQEKIKRNPLLSHCVRCQGEARLLKRGSHAFHCSVCQFEFCRKCGNSYHGDQQCLSTKEKRQNTIAMKYDNSSLSERTEMEKKYSRESLTNWSHNLQSLLYIKKNYKACPGCCTKIELIEGCDSVVCKSCNVAFCYNCLRITDAHQILPFRRAV